MSTNPALSPQQFEAVLTEASKTIAPENVKPMPLAERLAPHRKVLLKFRDKGYSPQQLATFLRHPQIAIVASPSFIRKFLLVQHRAPRKAQNADTTSA